MYLNTLVFYNKNRSTAFQLIKPNCQSKINKYKYGKHPTEAILYGIELIPY